MTPLMKSEDIAKYLGVSPATVKTWRSRCPDKLPPAVMVGDQPRWHPDTVEAWAKGGTRKAGRPRKL